MNAANSENSLHTQVVITGAGPTGLSMAAQLVRYGIDFIIIDKNNGPTTLSKALVVQARSLEIFRELGLAEQAIKTGQVTSRMNLFFNGKRKVSINISGLGKGISHFPFALSLEQSQTEQLLHEYLICRNKTVEWNTELTRIDRDNDCVIANVKKTDGTSQRIIADYLVACDGAGSEVRHSLQLPFSGTTEPKLFYVADVILNSPVIKDDELYMYMIRHAFVLFFPMEGDGHYRVIGVLPDKSEIDGEYRFADIEQSIKDQIISPVEFIRLKWFSTYKVHSRMAASFMKDRCFLAGDAAHIHTPAGGQGMNTGIQDAYNLAWKLAFVLKGFAGNTILGTYNTERMANARHLLQTTDRMFDIMSGINPFWNYIRVHIFPSFLALITHSSFVNRRIFPLLSQTGIAYPDSKLTIKSSIGKVKAGDRIPYFLLPDGRDVFSLLSEPTFKLLHFGNEQAELSIRGTAKLPIQFLNISDAPVDLFGRASNFFILLRPDNHISYIGHDKARCEELLNRFL